MVVHAPLAGGRLVGSLATGESSGIAWARWPIEVYVTGCLVRLRLVPAGPWQEYPDFRSEAATIQRFEGMEDQQIVVSSATGELLPHWARLPTRSATPDSGEPWEYAWTLEYWWPREQWSDALDVTWAARELEFRLDIDIDALGAATSPAST